jgi:hypothetical protein
MLSERQIGTDQMQRKQVRFARAVAEDARIGQKHPGVRRGCAPFVEVLELGRLDRDVIDDHIGHHLGDAGERCDVVPAAETGIHPRVIDRIETGVGAVDPVEEGEDVHAAEGVLQRALEQPLQIAERATRQAIDVDNELRLVFHASE